VTGLVALAALVACGPRSAPPAPAPAEPVAHEVLPDVPFAKLDHDQRAELMKERVVPAMAPMFRGHVAKLDCETCHGTPVDGSYRMPNPALVRLGDDRSRFKREDLDWMARDVTPAMARLLGRPEPAAGSGCGVCHVLE
jgi:hypothetical protein